MLHDLLFKHANSICCRVVTELLNDIRDNVGCLYKLSEAVAMVDMLQSFAHACTISNYGMAFWKILNTLN